MNRFARLLATIAALTCVCSAGPALADHHTHAECREGGEFIRNAAHSRDAGMARKDFIGRLISDLTAIHSIPLELRWFARDENDEQLLIEHAERVFDRPAEPLQHEDEFLGACMPQV